MFHSPVCICSTKPTECPFEVLKPNRRHKYRLVLMQLGEDCMINAAKICCRKFHSLMGNSTCEKKLWLMHGILKGASKLQPIPIQNKCHTVASHDVLHSLAFYFSSHIQIVRRLSAILCS